MTYDYCSRMPPELWASVVQNLPREDRQHCLLVSRLFRDLARPLLFSRVTIRMGIGNDENDEERFDVDASLWEWHNTVNEEILQHIACDSDFSKLVKEFSVRAHNEGTDVEWEPVILPHIIKALEVLPHLRSFRWYGTSPPLTSSVLDVLARTCGPTLAELSISVLDPSEDASQYLAQFTNLQTLSLAGETRQFPLRRRYEEVEPQLTAWAKNAPGTLRCLSVWRDGIWAAPLNVFSGLHELSLQLPRSLERLGFVLEHCSQLRSLNILVGELACGRQLTTALKAAPHALPHLVSLKLICQDQASVTDPSHIAAFLEGKKRVRRIDLALNRSFTSVTLDAYACFLGLLAALPQLEVVGLALKGKTFTRAHFKLLDERLPLGLSALLFTWNFQVFAGVSIEDWIAMLNRRVSLGYVHVSDEMGNLNLRHFLLKDHPPRMELLGYGVRMSGIQRKASTGEWAFAPLWDDPRMAFRTVEDFGCEDWEWLLRNHDAHGIWTLEPYFAFQEDKEAEYDSDY
ncbi:hypothetical protein C2E23DRAFT_251432 [Lenzites betulinus]|nr:hypothetical protein C2E23DRAFT_251432 [Lenzites betulinus]